MSTPQPSSQPKQHLEPGPGHPITIVPTGKHVTVRVGDRVIAETDDALTLQEASYPAVQYVPLESVDPAVLRPSTRETYCPYKGDATYFTVATDAGEIADAIWRYQEPYPAVADIAGRVAFYADKVAITVD